jgi:effector-binding domain-containing protein
MQIKTHPSMNVLYSSHQTSINKLHEHVGTVARDLYAEAARQHLLVTGPVYWSYYGMDGKPDTIFTLEIAIPVSGIADTENGFLFKEFPSFKCLYTLHPGAWNQLPQTYETLIKDVQQKGLQMNGVFREIYYNIDFSRDENNLTEVQVGII